MFTSPTGYAQIFSLAANQTATSPVTAPTMSRREAEVIQPIATSPAKMTALRDIESPVTMPRLNFPNKPSGAVASIRSVVNPLISFHLTFGRAMFDLREATSPVCEYYLEYMPTLKVQSSTWNSWPREGCGLGRMRRTLAGEPSLSIEDRG